VPRDLCNRGIQLLYAHALIGTGSTLELKAEINNRVEVKDGNIKCTHNAGCNFDSTGEGITLYQMKKDDVLPGREEAGARFATAPKAGIIAFCTKQLDEALDAESTYKAFRPIAGLSDADFEKLAQYTDAQYKSLADLTQAIHRLYQFKHVISHHFAAQQRKRDPGGYFDWDKYLGDAALSELRQLPEFKWDSADSARKPKGFAERTHTGNWPG
jgi:hypothetical protein